MSLLELKSLNYSPPASLLSPRRLAIALLFGDVLGLLLCFNLVYFLRFGQTYGLSSVAMLSIVAIVLIVFYIGDAYRPDLQLAGLWAPARTLISCLIVGVILAVLSYLLQATSLTQLTWRSVLLPGLSAFTGLALLLRFLASGLARSQARQSSCLLLGADTETLRFEQDFSAWNPQGRLVILADAVKSLSQSAPTSKRTLGSLQELSSWSSQSWSGVIVASHLKLTAQETQQLMQLRVKGTSIYQLPDFYEKFWRKLPSKFLKDSWLAFGNGFDLVESRISFKVKRIIDLLIAMSLLILLLPVLIFTALAIKLESAGPIFYSQLRNGQNAVPFRVYKFRSMYPDAERQGAQWAQKRDPRVTKVGYWLRLARIDELPQLWNVLKGDMSLIGPRPERPEFDIKLAAQIPYYNLRYLVKPGITGWAQVSYPYGASVEDAYEKLSYDLYYIKDYSIWLDLNIIFKTIRVVLLGKGR